ncbi:hypothetical protein AAHE18_05G085000 [Arachis hypogaea]|nr:uncharacterized protein DS421_5g142840 [Arachis hypogaea]
MRRTLTPRTRVITCLTVPLLKCVIEGSGGPEAFHHNRLHRLTEAHHGSPVHTSFKRVHAGPGQTLTFHVLLHAFPMRGTCKCSGSICRGQPERHQNWHMHGAIQPSASQPRSKPNLNKTWLCMQGRHPKPHTTTLLFDCGRTGVNMWWKILFTQV